MAFRIVSDQSLLYWVWRAHSGTTLLPAFQREWEWTQPKMAALIGSVLTGIPCGSLLLLEGRGDEFASRALGARPSGAGVTPSKPEGGQFLLDGQQRLTALLFTFSDYFGVEDWKSRLATVYSDLHYRWFLNLDIDDPENRDIFGYRDLHFSQEDFERLATDDVQPLCEAKKIHATTASKDWWHPNHPFKENGKPLTGGARRAMFARRCADERLLPLFLLPAEPGTGEVAWLNEPSTANQLFTKVLRDLAGRRLDAVWDKDADISTAGIGQKIRQRAEDDFGPDESEQREGIVGQWVNAVRSAIHRSLQKAIPATLAQADEIRRAVATFEAVNRGGTPLSQFDLLVARAARRPELSDFAGKVAQRLSEPLAGIPHHDGVSWSPDVMFHETESGRVPDVYKEHFGKAVALSCHAAKPVSPLRTETVKSAVILTLNAEEIAGAWEGGARALNRTIAFLQFHCGLIQMKDLDAQQLLIPIIWALRLDANWSPRALARIEYYYWVSRFSDTFGTRPTETAIEDSAKLLAWLQEDGKRSANPFVSRQDRVMNTAGFSDPAALLLLGDGEVYDEAAFLRGELGVAPDRQLVLKNRGRATAVIMDYLLSRGPVDFPTSAPPPLPRLRPWELSVLQKTTGENPIHVHHVLPLGSAATLSASAQTLRKDPKNIHNSPLNCSIASKKSNLAMGAMAPAVYLPSVAQVTTLMESHFLPEGFETGTIQSFLVARFKRLKAALAVEFDTLLDL